MATLRIELADGRQAGETIQTIKKELAAAAKEMQKATINSKEFADSSKRYNEIKDRLKDVTTQQQAVVSGSDMLKKAWNNLPGAGMFNQVSESLGMAKQGVGGLVSQFGILRMAIAATGIGLFVLAVGALFTAFKNLTPVVDKVEQVLGGLKAIIQEVFNRWLNFVSGYIKFITGDFKEGMDQMTGSFNGLADSVKKAYDEGVKLAELQQDLDDRNRGIVISNAQAEASINRLITASKNRTLAERERLALLDDAEKIATAQFQKQQQLEEDNFKLLMEKAKQKSDLNEQEILQLAEGTLAQEIEYARRGDLDDDLLKEIADKYAQMIKMEGQQNVLMEKINNHRDKLAEARKAKEEKEVAAREKALEKELVEQEKWLQKKQALNEKYDAFNISRMEANAKREADIAKAAMDQAMKSINDRIAADEKASINKKALAEAEAKMNSEVLAVFNEGVNSTIALLSADVASRKKHANDIKILQSGQVVINGLVEISEIAKTFATLGPLGQVLAVARIAFAAFRTRAAVRSINEQKFETGGPIYGPRHSQGGVPINAEGGEFIFSRKAVSAIGMNTLNAINKSLTFADGGMVPKNPFEGSGSAYSGNSVGRPDNPFAGFEELKESFKIYAEKVDTWAINLRVTNNLTATKEGLSTLLQIQNEWDV